jgi:hypothetical protein
MSHDLYFRPRVPKASPGVEELTAYFRERKNYQVTEKQALYENEATGVYFIFDLVAAEDDEQSDASPASLNLNYFRPHIFGLEAAPELKAFVERFDFLVADPQINGMGDGEFTTEGFLRGWNHGNAFAYRAMIGQNREQPLLTLPTARIEECWRWNSAKDELQEQLGEDIFVPRILFMERAGTVATAVAWPDGIPIAFPESDVVLIQRKQILPRRFFRSVEDMVMANRSEVEPIVNEFPLEQGALPYRLLSYTSVPESVISQLRAFEAAEEKPNGVSVDRVLNTELVEAARKGAT